MSRAIARAVSLYKNQALFDGAMRFPQTGHALIWLLILLVGIAALIGYWYYQPQRAPAWLRQHVSNSSDTTTPLYRWQDKQGGWHVTDVPPEGLPYETGIYRRDVNVLPSQDAERNH